MAYNYIYLKYGLLAIGPLLVILAQFLIVFMLATACEDFHGLVNKAIDIMEEMKIDYDKDDNLVIFYMLKEF